MTIPFQNRDVLHLNQHPKAHKNRARDNEGVMETRPWEALEAIPSDYDSLGNPTRAFAVGRSNARMFWPSIYHQSRWMPNTRFTPARPQAKPTESLAHDYISGTYVSDSFCQVLENSGGLAVKASSRLLGDNALNADLSKGFLDHTGIDHDPWKPWVPMLGSYGRRVGALPASTTGGFLPHSMSGRFGRRHKPGAIDNDFNAVAAVDTHGKDRLVGRPAHSPMVKGTPVAWIPGSRKDQGHYLGIAGWGNLLVSDFRSRVTTRQEAIFTTRVADLDSNPNNFGAIDPTLVAPLSTMATVVRQIRDKRDSTLAATTVAPGSAGFTPPSLAWVGGLSPTSIYAGRGQMTSHGHYSRLNEQSVFNTTGPGPGSCETPNAVMYASDTGGGPITSGAGAADTHSVGEDQFGVPHVPGHVDGRCPIFYSPQYDATDKHSGIFRAPLAPTGFPVEVFKVTDLDDFHRAAGPEFKEKVYFGLHKWQTFVPVFIPDPKPDPPPKEEIPFEPSEPSAQPDGQGSPILLPDEITVDLVPPEEAPTEQEIVEFVPDLAASDPFVDFGEQTIARREFKANRARRCALPVVTEQSVANVGRVAHHWLPTAHGTLLFRPEPTDGVYKDAPYSGKPDQDYFKTPLGPGLIPFGSTDKHVLEGTGHRFALPMAHGGVTFAPASYSLDSRVKDIDDCPRFLFVVKSEATGDCAGKGRIGFGTPTTEGKMASGMSLRYQQDGAVGTGLVVATHNSSAVETDVFRIYDNGGFRLGAAGASARLSSGGLTGDRVYTFTDENGVIPVKEGMVAWFGDASDGDVTVDVASSPVELERDYFYGTLVVESSGVLDTKGHRIFAREILVENGGTIQNAGTDASGATAGAGADAGTLGGGESGGAGGLAGGPGTAGTASNPGIGGAGGDADTVLGGAVTQPDERPRALPQAANLRDSSGTAYAGGAGGAGGDGPGGNDGGGGGGGGGVIYLAARTIELEAGAVIDASGGDGGAATGTGSDGGGGGGGGVIIAVYQTESGLSAAADVSGGAAGAATAGGVAGSAGADGEVIELRTA